MKGIQKNITNTEAKKKMEDICISLDPQTIVRERVKPVMKNVHIFSNRIIMCCRIYYNLMYLIQNYMR